MYVIMIVIFIINYIISYFVSNLDVNEAIIKALQILNLKKKYLINNIIIVFMVTYYVLCKYMLLKSKFIYLFQLTILYYV